jgi:hypothetical protein
MSRCSSAYFVVASRATDRSDTSKASCLWANEADDDWTLGRGWDDELDESDAREVPFQEQWRAPRGIPRFLSGISFERRHSAWECAEGASGGVAPGSESSQASDFVSGHGSTTVDEAVPETAIIRGVIDQSNLDDRIAAIGPWQGESTEELIEILLRERDASVRKLPDLR